MQRRLGLPGNRPVDDRPNRLRKVRLPAHTGPAAGFSPAYLTASSSQGSETPFSGCTPRLTNS